MIFHKFKRIDLLQEPTPLQEMRNLSHYLGGPRIFIKRDDCTGIALGGTEARMFEYSMAEAVFGNYDTVITMGRIQSNLFGCLASVANMFKLKLIVVIAGKEPEVLEGNLLLARLANADMRFMSEEMFVPDQPPDHLLDALAKEIQKSGGKPYILPLGGGSPLGALGLVKGTFELMRQLDDKKITIDYLVVPSLRGAATHAGLAIGALGLNTGYQVIGFSVRRKKEFAQKRVLNIAKGICDILKWPIDLSHKNFEVDDNYTDMKLGAEAANLLARLEGIYVDPMHQGKALAGLIDYIKKGIFKKEHNIVLWHGGGHGMIFDFKKDLQSAMSG